MGRRPNPQRREELLSEILEYVERHGLADLSLRPLANALGTSTYTLTYQFGSKDEMLSGILDAIDAREAAAPYNDSRRPMSERIGLLWEHMQEPSGRAAERLRIEALLTRARLAPMREPSDAGPTDDDDVIDVDELIGEPVASAAVADEPLIGEPIAVDLRAENPFVDDPAARLIWSAAQGLVLEFLRTGSAAGIDPAIVDLQQRAAELEKRQPDPAISA